MAKTTVIAAANQKGGAGKSTTVYNLGAGLAMDGKRMLLVDVDPQGDLTKMLGQRRPHEMPLTLSDKCGTGSTVSFCFSAHHACISAHYEERHMQ